MKEQQPMRGILVAQADTCLCVQSGVTVTHSMQLQVLQERILIYPTFVRLQAISLLRS
jgi:hypothetical protein